MNDIIESIKFLQSLGLEMINQDNDCQADPRFWVVAQNKKEYGVDSGYADGEIVCGDDGAEWEDAQEFIEYLLENEYLTEKNINPDYNYDLEEVLDILGNNDFTLVGYRDNLDSICENTMFLTKSDCKKHIELNHYHYKNPHTYAMTAWRSPQVEKLYDVIKNTDWEKLEFAITAFEQQNKEPCERCKGREQIWTYKDREYSHYRAKYCPHCSRKLEE